MKKMKTRKELFEMYKDSPLNVSDIKSTLNCAPCIDEKGNPCVWSTGIYLNKWLEENPDRAVMENEQYWNIPGDPLFGIQTVNLLILSHQLALHGIGEPAVLSAERPSYKISAVAVNLYRTLADRYAADFTIFELWEYILARLEMYCYVVIGVLDGQTYRTSFHSYCDNGAQGLAEALKHCEEAKEKFDECHIFVETRLDVYMVEEKYDGVNTRGLLEVGEWK